MLIDKLRIDFKAGNGGDGAVTFAKFGRSLGKNQHLYYPDKGKPDGGNGSDGGDIYVEGSSNVYDLASFSKQKVYRAEDGKIGLKGNKLPPKGEDLILIVPLVTIISDVTGKKVITIRKHGERKLLVKGGAGGEGNYAFRAGQLETLSKHTVGQPGRRLKSFMELRLPADVIFIGFPNAGKSSMLNVLTNANVKVASYPFTTLHPQLGMMGRITLMDLPGLISGVAEGKGLGKSFNKHTTSSKLIAHFISLESDNPERDYLAIRSELEAFNNDLMSKEEIILLTKSDLFTEEEIQAKMKPLLKYNKEILIVSNTDKKGIETISEKFENIIIPTKQP